jgi:hypothetical protein
MIEIENVAHMYSEILFSHTKKEIMLFATMLMDLEDLILNEVSLIQNDKYSTNVGVHLSRIIKYCT